MAQKKSKHSWQYNKMMALVRGLEFKTVEEYFEYIVTSKINGCLSQCCILFKEMPKEYRKEFLSYLADEVFRSGSKEMFYLLKLLIEEI